MNKSDNLNCRLCGSEPETIIHLFTECPVSIILWRSVERWIRDLLNIEISFSPNQIILGYLLKDSDFLPINTILIVTKYYIFLSAHTSRPLDILNLKSKIKNVYMEQKLLAEINLIIDDFEKHWSRFKHIF